MVNNKIQNHFTSSLSVAVWSTCRIQRYTSMHLR